MDSLNLQDIAASINDLITDGVSVKGQSNKWDTAESGESYSASQFKKAGKILAIIFVFS